MNKIGVIQLFKFATSFVFNFRLCKTRIIGLLIAPDCENQSQANRSHGNSRQQQGPQRPPGPQGPWTLPQNEYRNITCVNRMNPDWPEIWPNAELPAVVAMPLVVRRFSRLMTSTRICA